MELVLLLRRKYSDRLFKNNGSKDQAASEVVRNSRKREQETVREKEEYELEKYLKHIEICLENFKIFKYEGQESMVAGDKKDEPVKLANGISYWMNV